MASASQEEPRKEQAGGPVNCSNSELSIYLQALGEAFLPTCFSDTNQSVQSKSMSIASMSYQRGRKTVAFHGFPYLLMSRHSTGYHGAGLSMSSAEASRARTSAQPVKAQGSTAREAGSGEKWRELSVRYDPGTSSWKTHRCLWDEDLPESSVNLPKWGLMRAGVLWERTTLVPPISGSGAGLWRTPTVGMLNADRAKDPGYTARKEAKGQTITLADQVKNPRLFPTPTASLGTKGGRVTPRKSREGGTLIEAVSARAIWSTPQARDFRAGQSERYENPARTKNLNDHIGGQLNPDWVEWLMNWPAAWSSLDAIDKHEFERWRGASAGWWDRDPSQPAGLDDGQIIPRVVSGIVARVDRLKAIGNGQVPQCAAHAWRVLCSG